MLLSAQIDQLAGLLVALEPADRDRRRPGFRVSPSELVGDIFERPPDD